MNFINPIIVAMTFMRALAVSNRAAFQRPLTRLGSSFLLGMVPAMSVTRTFSKRMGDGTVARYERPPRQAIVFTLVPQSGLSMEAEDLATEVPSNLPLVMLKRRALEAATTPGEASPRIALVNVGARSKAVRDYVLTRAAGACEACQNPAPFLTGTGQPYLEAHHIHKLSDGGPDHPTSVAALCPNCHRQADFGANQVILNNKLLERVRQLEK